MLTDRQTENDWRSEFNRPSAGLRTYLKRIAVVSGYLFPGASNKRNTSHSVEVSGHITGNAITRSRTRGGDVMAGKMKMKKEKWTKSVEIRQRREKRKNRNEGDDGKKKIHKEKRREIKSKNENWKGMVWQKLRNREGKEEERRNKGGKETKII